MQHGLNLLDNLMTHDEKPFSMTKAFETNATRREQREGPHLGSEFRGRSTCQRHDTPRPTRDTTYCHNFEDAPRTSVTTRRKQREGLHLRREFQGRSMRQRHDVPETARGSPLTPRIWRTLHAPMSRCAENYERVKLTPRMSRMLHMPASRRAENNERVATNVLNFEDAPRASVTTRGKQREGRHLRPQFQGRSTRQRHDVPETARGSPLTLRISRTLHAPASRRAENNERAATYVQSFEDAPRASVTTRGKQMKTTRGSPLTATISRTLHAPASRRAGRPTDRPTDRPSPF